MGHAAVAKRAEATVVVSLLPASSHPCPLHIPGSDFCHSRLGAPGWLCRLSVGLWLRSRSHGSWVPAGDRALFPSLSLPVPHSYSLKSKYMLIKKKNYTGTPGWLSRLSVRLLVSAQAMISLVRGLELRIGLCADSAEPGWDSVGPSLSAPRPHQNK